MKGEGEAENERIMQGQKGLKEETWSKLKSKRG